MSPEPIRAAVPWDETGPEDALSVDGQEWRLRAACRGMDPDLFFPSRGDRVATEKAKEICSRCPVRADCLAHALNIAPSFDHGIYGGLTRGERAAIRRRRSSDG